MMNNIFNLALTLQVTGLVAICLFLELMDIYSILDSCKFNHEKFNSLIDYRNTYQNRE